MDQAPRYLKPGWLTSRVLNPLLMRVGMVPTLAVRGRTSGEWRTVPVNVLELDGQRYLVAPRGETQWVRNLRATGRGELRWRGRVEPFRAIEIPDNEKPRVIEAYLARWGYQVKGYFKALPLRGPAADPRRGDRPPCGAAAPRGAGAGARATAGAARPRRLTPRDRAHRRRRRPRLFAASSHQPPVALPGPPPRATLRPPQ
jgi:deazaflavin-dependent oxidoreductase (nitroreductase family)